LLGSAPLVVEADDGSVRPGQRGDDEANAGEELAEMMLDLGDDAAGAVPGAASFVSSYAARRLYLDCRRGSASGNWQLREAEAFVQQPIVGFWASAIESSYVG